jgi:3-phosphoshikimate 1-carboxyvinyltransferase
MMGARIVNQEALLITGPNQLLASDSEMDCGGSGTTLRIFTALAALAHGQSVLTGDQSLLARPMTELLQALRQLGIDASSVRGNERPPVQVIGQGIDGGDVKIRGDVSSQYISGLLFACAKARDDTRIEITTKLESRPYVDMTIEVLREFGVHAEPSIDWSQISIPGNQVYSETNYHVPGDYSSAAFLLVAGALCGQVTVNGLDKKSSQGDSLIVQLLEKMGVEIKPNKDGYVVRQSRINSLDIDVSNTPDLVPILAVLASQAEGRTHIINARRLRLKESDRLATTTMELRKMGMEINESEDGITIDGPSLLRGAQINSHHDHRIAMACSVAGLIARGTTSVEGIECVAKSYPDFLQHMQSLGARLKLENNNKGRMKI